VVVGISIERTPGGYEPESYPQAVVERQGINRGFATEGRSTAPFLLKRRERETGEEQLSPRRALYPQENGRYPQG
jgi:hypothetical protein